MKYPMVWYKGYKTKESTMTPSNWNIFRVTDPLCGEFTGHRWIPRTKASDAELWCFFHLRIDKRLSKCSRGWWFETPSRSLWRHYNTKPYSEWLQRYHKSKSSEIWWYFFTTYVQLIGENKGRRKACKYDCFHYLLYVKNMAIVDTHTYIVLLANFDIALIAPNHLYITVRWLYAHLRWIYWYTLIN